MAANFETRCKRSARRAGLCYVCDDSPGITRRRRGHGFSYHRPDGSHISDKGELQRLRALAIPPAWEQVWICPNPDGHLQATGRDAAGRKQYRYHPRWERIRQENKFAHLADFGRGLGGLRRRVDRDLKQSTSRRDRLLAAAVRLLDLTLIRVGNERYAQRSGAQGLTTLHAEDAHVHGGEVEFSYTAKGGQQRTLAADDPAVAKVIRRCHELPGQALLTYRDEAGQHHELDSGHINDYLRSALGQDASAKEFRTWGGTVLAAITLARLGWDERKTYRKKNKVRAVKAVARRLGNRAATCRKYYVHPAVLEAYDRRQLAASLNDTPRPERPVPRQGLSVEEQGVLTLLEQEEK